MAQSYYSCFSTSIHTLIVVSCDCFKENYWVNFIICNNACIIYWQTKYLAVELDCYLLRNSFIYFINLLINYTKWKIICVLPLPSSSLEEKILLVLYCFWRVFNYAFSFPSTGNYFVCVSKFLVNFLYFDFIFFLKLKFGATQRWNHLTEKKKRPLWLDRITSPNKNKIPNKL